MADDDKKKKQIPEILTSKSRNQHFLSEAEQKLNSIGNTKLNGSKIYSFRVLERDKYSLELESERGQFTKSNMSIFDLYSFDVSEDSSIRMNFEALFQKYENNVASHTNSLLQKLSSGTNDIKAEVIDLFAAKMLNFIRNPFSIEKILNTFPIGTFEPTDPVLLSCYQRVISGRKPHQEELCSRLGITEQVYVDWLRVLFNLLVPLREGQPNIFEQTIKSLIEDRETIVSALVFEYDSNCCLISDRGFSQPVPDGKLWGFSFNLRANAFIHYIFANVDEQFGNRFSPEVVELYKNGPKMLNVTPYKNELSQLAQYNRRVIEQCFERVYCSTSEIMLSSS